MALSTVDRIVEVFIWHGHDGLGWEDNLEMGTLASELSSSLGLNVDPAINCHSGVSQAGQGVNVWGDGL